jgi:CheY-like chemotaxis protein/HPt (histidine-containing phosphotransfer) domain-containing protein
VLGKPITSSSLFNAVTETVTARGQAGERAIADRPHDGGQRLAGTRILVVDDSKLNQIVVGRIMEREGAWVAIAGDGLAAVSQVQAAPTGFDAVLMDIQMPELDGIEATRRIRSIAECAHLPIIAVTAGAMASERQLALAAGVNEVISKPFDPEVVVASVRRHINQLRDLNSPVPAPAPAPREAPSSDWAVVGGNDANDVALRLDGDVAMFRMLLGLFIADLDELEDALSVPPSGEQVPLIAQRLHKLRGTAGNLGARDLFSVASETEQSLRADHMPQVLEGLRRVLDELARLRRSAVAVLEAPPPSAANVVLETVPDVAHSTPRA